MRNLRKYLLGDFHQSQLAILVALFFAMSGLGFALIKQSHYAFAGLIIATLIYKFSYRFIELFQPSDQEIAFTLELDVLVRFIANGLLPAVLILQVTQANSLGLFIAILYTMAVAIRIAYFNQGGDNHQDLYETYSVGLPIETSALILPLISLLGYVIGPLAFAVLFALVCLFLAGAYIVNFPIPRIPARFEMGVMIALLVLSFIIIWVGPLPL